MDGLPDPMTPPDCDLRDFPAMLLDVVRLRDSELSAGESAEAFRAAVLSWCVSWHQLPAGSLPNDDAKLAYLLGYGRDLTTWRAARAAGGMHGWVLCSDGRLYHPFVAEKVMALWPLALRIRAREIRRYEMENGKWSELRFEVFQRDNFTCTYCGTSKVRLECDHVLPLSRGGKTDPSNLATACTPCNRRKGTRTPAEWLR